ncbi:MAG TPA: DUF2752 domain-containing protein [Balneolaceae bacterium]|nr:DUF2752 domain-containing protein [Balneolaceae bacterium]|tara:strand:+ start:115906 stop:116214 length:309 start_codon:yes stop_codon:yes gene_type:complete
MKILKKHIEWMVFLGGLLLMATMNPYNNGTSLCLFELLGAPFCLGDGLGHSIAFLFRGEIRESLNANFMGPLAVLILSARILSIWKRLFFNNPKNKMEPENV